MRVVTDFVIGSKKFIPSHIFLSFPLASAVYNTLFFNF
ncbi:hypothetical protein BPUTEOMOX_1915 [methanotrophic endosymbiont of Bathymodiolus puteoserpentis (Logatchev)]|nr:hypothetical protein BPUTEOMOX_1915 [methanotrophic endosymbiont of Bathymodiolus puteoserpentis (Logatchev)]